jgi:hypothetical protein
MPERGQSLVTRWALAGGRGRVRTKPWHILRVPLERLLSDDAHQSAAACVDGAEAAAIRDVLRRYDVASGRFGVPERPDPVAVNLVGREAAYG